ncbi:MAG: hypothetical protein HQK88_14865 [Nitrospirae bacterium]|nr:hypothetical protein [Nitrospirota bacterium]MBF0535943.1 hypothetical protein [Nitrospirota bacterium]MBF0618081.1 hypothetical protein [Nitrospirota bacterium]
MNGLLLRILKFCFLVIPVVLTLFILADETGAEFTATKATVRNKEISAKLKEAQMVLDERKKAKTLTQKEEINYQHWINIIRTKAVRKEQRGMSPQETEELSKSLDVLIIEIKTPVESK